uniref:Small ribosomal subunit protein uS3m n=1 Tax=Rhodotorula toruloides (strain NP11) TaxID=1130832 RepID=A0A7G8ZGE5_RHOT1|nr:ribosomal protein S3 [Rhodotorula toruloides]QNL17830.1 ribosomal protein S3 [Rhodotorula toruloides]CAE5968160.1 ribosomal protein S3 [Rhodotorula toruloides]
MNAYQFAKSNAANLLKTERYATAVVTACLSAHEGLLLAKPIFAVQQHKVTVHVFYYWPGRTLQHASIATLGGALTSCFASKVVELRLVQLSNMSLDSSILAQCLALQGNKLPFNRIAELLKSLLTPVFNDAMPANSLALPVSSLTGLQIKLSGRLTTQRYGPRQTVSLTHMGSAAKSSIGMTDYSQFTAKNKLGAFTVKVWLSQHSS